MSLEKKYDSGFYKIEVDTDRNLLKSVWLRPVSTEELIAGGTKLYEVLRECKVEKAIADARILTSLSTESKDWMSSKFYELLSQTQLKRLARVLPSEVYHRIALESVVTRAEALGVTKFDVKNFTSPAEALTWLMN
ncbi:hypothetical protein [Pontibacter anaerobius]|uniref:STAS/SEC14 domain-containing protein n=1 Tax=Pontibacter anaerobius TaxID=2993940 RepID=A0ABT3RK70_9BACT|nr:hypothetical protein [Pontibacter anaerobius]MCX2741595.1 hypothetical protein [Pontibacter anaerobius]